jgi:type II restriction enzyme
MTEGWAENNFYCPKCLQPRVTRQRAGFKVMDFSCPNCFQTYSLESQKTPFRKTVRDSDYYTFLESINNRRNPDQVLLHYDRQRLVVVDVEVIPSFFFTESCIIPSNPSKPKARKKPWQGCSFSLEMVPEDGHVEIVKDERIASPQDVHEKYEKAAKLMVHRTLKGRGWTTDVLRCLRDMRKSSFNLEDIYAYERELQNLHPDNKFVRPKIRQQLQVLRDHEILRFIKRGQYELIQR